jgi:hypothetical protein
MSQEISASVSLVIEPLLSLLYFSLSSRIFFSAEKVNIFPTLDPSRQYVGTELRFLIHSGHFLLDKGRIFYLRWGVRAALKKPVQGEEAMERKVKRAPGNNTGPLNVAATGEEYGA